MRHRQAQKGARRDNGQTVWGAKVITVDVRALSWARRLYGSTSEAPPCILVVNKVNSFGCRAVLAHECGLVGVYVVFLGPC